MSQVYLVAIEHGAHGELVNQNSFPLMRDLVLPRLTEDTVIVAEGGYNRGEMGRFDPGYERFFRSLGPDIYYSGMYPRIFSDDPMYHVSDRAGVRKKMAQAKVYFDAVTGFCLFPSLPKTWEECVERIRGNHHEATPQGKLPKRWRVFAKQMKQEFERRDQGFAGQIQRYEKKGGPVLFVGGILHCLVLSARYGWPVLRYECSEEYIEGLYATWYQTYKLAELLNNPTNGR